MLVGTEGLKYIYKSKDSEIWKILHIAFFACFVKSTINNIILINLIWLSSHQKIKYAEVGWKLGSIDWSLFMSLKIIKNASEKLKLKRGEGEVFIKDSEDYTNLTFGRIVQKLTFLQTRFTSSWASLEAPFCLA